MIAGCGPDFFINVILTMLGLVNAIVLSTPTLVDIAHFGILHKELEH